jgi:hypothetical protein
MCVLLLVFAVTAHGQDTLEAQKTAAEQGAKMKTGHSLSFLRVRVHSPRPSDQVLAVVNNFHKMTSTDWLTNAHIPVDDVGVCMSDNMTSTEAHLCERHVNEAYPWVQWIIEHHGHFNTQYVAFLHGHESGWHSPADGYLQHLKSDRPTTVKMLSDDACRWGGPPIMAHVGVPEGPGVDIISHALYGEDFMSVWNSSGMLNNFKCCSEMIVNTDAIDAVDKRVFEGLASLMEKHPEQPWGWIMERSWQNLFSRKIVRPAEEAAAMLGEAEIPADAEYSTKEIEDSWPSNPYYYYVNDDISEGTPCTCASCSRGVWYKLQKVWKRTDRAESSRTGSVHQQGAAR